MSGNFARDLDNLPDAEAAAAPEIADQRLMSFEAIQSQHVSRRQVVHVDVVAHASPIFSGVIAAEDRDEIALS